MPRQYRANLGRQRTPEEKYFHFFAPPGSALSPAASMPATGRQFVIFAGVARNADGAVRRAIAAADQHAARARHDAAAARRRRLDIGDAGNVSLRLRQLDTMQPYQFRKDSQAAG